MIKIALGVYDASSKIEVSHREVVGFRAA